MMHNVHIEQFLKGKWKHPETGEARALPIRHMMVEEELSDEAFSCLSELDLGKKCAVISDVNTHSILADKIAKQLHGRMEVQEIILPHGVKPEQSVVEKIKQTAKGCQFMLAVGSGTINDLVKAASAALLVPYVVFATAPSMNGYATPNASLIIDGFRTSIAAQMPTAIYMDVSVMKEAPLRLIRSGIGDVLCRASCQFDWYLSHRLLGTSYDKAPFILQEMSEETFLDQYERVLERGAGITALLSEWLILSGIGMWLAGGSYPASQSEHMLAHTMEMSVKKDPWPISFHGEQVAVCCLVMAQMQEQLLNKGVQIEQLYQPFPGDLLLSHIGEVNGRYAKEEFEKKAARFSDRGQIEQRLANEWGSIESGLSSIYVPYQDLYKIFEHLGIPTTPEAIGWPASAFKKSVQLARFTRDRFTTLDVVV